MQSYTHILSVKPSHTNLPAFPPFLTPLLVPFLLRSSCYIPTYQNHSAPVQIPDQTRRENLKPYARRQSACPEAIHR